jgi:glutathione S-transferase
VLRLVTIPISHYCEKARWALERAGLAYREERHVQLVHRFYARRAGGGATVPVLVTPDGAIGDSALILDWIDARTPPEHRLFPAAGPERDEVLGLCARFDEILGPRGRRLVYVHMLAQPDLMLEFNNQGVPRWEDRFLRSGWPVIVRLARRALDITPGVEVGDEAAVWAEFDFVAERLSDGRPYLCGERFTAADLTFAALSATMVGPHEYGVALPSADRMPAQTAELVLRARAHPAGQFAVSLFEERRGERVAA